MRQVPVGPSRGQAQFITGEKGTDPGQTPFGAFLGGGMANRIDWVLDSPFS